MLSSTRVGRGAWRGVRQDRLGGLSVDSAGGGATSARSGGTSRHEGSRIHA